MINLPYKSNEFSVLYLILMEIIKKANLLGGKKDLGIFNLEN